MSSRLCHTSSAFRTNKTGEQLQNCVSKEDTHDWLYDNKPHLLTAGEKRDVLALRANRQKEAELKKREGKIEKAVKKKTANKSKKPNTLDRLLTKLENQDFVGAGEFNGVKVLTLNSYVSKLRTSKGMKIEVVRAEGGKITGWRFNKKLADEKKP